MIAYISYNPSVRVLLSKHFIHIMPHGKYDLQGLILLIDSNTVMIGDIFYDNHDDIIKYDIVGCEDLCLNHHLSYFDPKFKEMEAIISLKAKDGTISKMDLKSENWKTNPTSMEVKAYALAGLCKTLDDQEITYVQINNALMKQDINPLPKWCINYITGGICFEECSSNGKMTVEDIIREAKISSRER